MKKLFTIILCGIILLCFTGCGQENEDYTAKLLSVMNEKEKVTVEEIFSFEFDRAYIFNFEDGYIDGENFAKKYNVDISISQVEAGEADYIQRIVFVDATGSFVYEFKCIIDDVFFLEKGIVIYPETIIERKSSQEVSIHFESSERYAPESAY